MYTQGHTNILLTTNTFCVVPFGYMDMFWGGILFQLDCSLIQSFWRRPKLTLKAFRKLMLPPGCCFDSTTDRSYINFLHRLPLVCALILFFIFHNILDERINDFPIATLLTKFSTLMSLAGEQAWVRCSSHAVQSNTLSSAVSSCSPQYEQRGLGTLFIL